MTKMDHLTLELPHMGVLVLRVLVVWFLLLGIVNGTASMIVPLLPQSLFFPGFRAEIDDYQFGSVGHGRLYGNPRALFAPFVGEMTIQKQSALNPSRELPAVTIKAPYEHRENYDPNTPRYKAPFKEFAPGVAEEPGCWYLSLHLEMPVFAAVVSVVTKAGPYAVYTVEREDLCASVRNTEKGVP